MNAKESASNPYAAAFAGATAGGITRMITAPLDVVKIRMQLQGKKTGLGSGIRLMQSMFKEEGVVCFWRGNVPATGLWVAYAGTQFGCYAVLRQNECSAWWKGGVAGVVATVVTYPLDFMRTVFAGQKIPKVHGSLWQLVRTTLKDRGYKGFYQGMVPALIHIGPYAGLTFAYYEYLMRYENRYSWCTPGMCGGIAGFSAKWTVYPMDTIKKRMQMQSCLKNQTIGRYPSSLHCVRDIVQKEGFFALYRGTIPSLVKAFATTGITFAIYEKTLCFFVHGKRSYTE